MIYSEMPLIFLLAAFIGCSASVMLLFAIVAGIAAAVGGRKAVLWHAAAALILLPIGIWGATSAMGFMATAKTNTIAHFEDYGFQLTSKEAAQIRAHREGDHMMYLDTAEGVTEVLFRNVDGAVVPHTVNDTGLWTPLEAAG